jgi:uncharacterized membrane protein YoaK (UPF0700 family)
MPLINPTEPSAAAPSARRWPWAGRWAGHDLGPLPLLLITLTVATGMVDAVSFLAFGRVFVANMTGNVVFLGFALAGASGLSAPASLAALAAFLLGALVGGRIAESCAEHRGRHLRTATTVALGPMLIAVAIAAVVGQPVSGGARYALIVPLALAMGIQNATARSLAIPDLTTTVLTMTLTGIAADSRLAGGKGAQLARRSVSVVAMFAGALISGLLVIEVDVLVPVAVAAVLVAGAALCANAFAKADVGWTRRPGGP